MRANYRESAVAKTPFVPGRFTKITRIAPSPALELKLWRSMYGREKPAPQRLELSTYAVEYAGQMSGIPPVDEVGCGRRESAMRDCVAVVRKGAEPCGQRLPGIDFVDGPARLRWATRQHRGRVFPGICSACHGDTLHNILCKSPTLAELVYRTDKAPPPPVPRLMAALRASGCDTESASLWGVEHLAEVLTTAGERPGAKILTPCDFAATGGRDVLSRGILPKQQERGGALCFETESAKLLIGSEGEVEVKLKPTSGLPRRFKLGRAVTIALAKPKSGRRYPLLLPEDVRGEVETCKGIASNDWRRPHAEDRDTLLAN